MKKKIAVLTLCGLLFALCFSAEAQSPAKVPKIGFLSSGGGSRPWHESLQREFRKLGYVEGKTIVFESRFADTKYDRLPALAEELIRLKVEVIITPGSNDTRAAKSATRTIPIVFTGAGSDPVALGLVDSLARPGGNVTGFAQIGSGLAGKRLDCRKPFPSFPGLQCCGIPRMRLYSDLGRKPTAGKRPGSAASFFEGKQRGSTGERLQRRN